MAQISRVTSINQIPGWFPWVDQQVFGHFLGRQAVVPTGDVVELGVYLGKSAAFLGYHVDPSETLTVCDLFGAPSDDAENRRENAKSYSTLDRGKFERNYLALHPNLPVVVQGPSSVILDHVKPDSARFVHVDASHLHAHVVVDVESARTMLAPEGIVSFDDYRSAHTPGVSAAVWGAVATGGLSPICVTVQKLYGTFGDPAPHHERVKAWLAATPGVHGSTTMIDGTPVVQVWNDPPKKAPAPDAAQLLARVEKRLDGLEQAVRRMPKPELDLATKVVRRVRAARRRARWLS